MSKQKPLPDLFESSDPSRYQIREVDGAEFLKLASEVEASGGRVETVKVAKRNCDWVVGFRMGAALDNSQSRTGAP